MKTPNSKSSSKSSSIENPQLATPASPALASPPANPSPPVPPASPVVTSVANGSNKGTKVELQTSYVGLVAGLLAYYQPGDVFQLKTGPITRDELIQKFQEFIAAAEATKQTYTAWRADVQTERAVETGVRPYRNGVHDQLKARFGRDGVQLLAFGFTPEQPKKKTVKALAAGVAKAEAPRAARGTKGAVQKAAVKGDVTSVQITPVTAAPNPPPKGA
jgi:hypothetical protein